MAHSQDECDLKGAYTPQQLISLLYEELRRMAAAKLARENQCQSLNATALVHEAWLRLGGGGDAEPAWQNRAHFFGAAAEAMRRILVDRARRRRTARHGGARDPINCDDVEIVAPFANDDILALHDALERLEASDPGKAELVKLRFFAGLTFEEAAEVLGISLATAKRRWTYARAWLYRAIGGEGAGLLIAVAAVAWNQS